MLISKCDFNKFRGEHLFRNVISINLEENAHILMYFNKFRGEHSYPNVISVNLWENTYIEM